jgi:tetratricopeptide (TPR) repeat protein
MTETLSAEELLRQAQAALAARDDARALQLWAQARAAFPREPAGYARAAKTLARLGRFGEAEPLLAEAAALAPRDLAIAVERAWLAHHRRDLPEALRRWQDLRERFPLQAHGFAGALASLREANRLEEAEPLLLEAVRRFPNDVGVAQERGRFLHLSRDWLAALQHWEAVRARFPQLAAVSYTQAAIVLQELGVPDVAAALLDAGIERLPDESGVLAARARLASSRQDWRRATALWARLRERFPGQVTGWLGGAQCLRDQRLDEEAEAMLAAAVERFPAEPLPAIEHAMLASRRKDWATAITRWALVRERFPSHLAGYLWAARALRESGQLDDAEAMLAATTLRLPDNAELAVEYAWLASRRADWAAAAGRWQAVRERFTHVALAYSFGAAALRELGQSEAAEQLLGAAVERFPTDAESLIAHARLALSRGDHDTAVQRFERAVARCPAYWAAHAGLAQSLAGAGRLDDADRVLGAALQRFPAELAAHVEYAAMATRRRAWKDAVERWDEAQRIFPGEARLVERRDAARRRLVETDPLVADAMAPDAPEARALMREILLDFESLGGALHGCEFGLVQRWFKAEPLGLLRWTEISSDELIAALELRLAGVGLPEYTFVRKSPDGERRERFEYVTYDNRFGMRMHTFTYTDQVEEDEMLQKSCRRLQYLAGKLLADIASAEKIFVFKISAGNLPEPELLRLHAAIRAIGPATLLYVQYEAAGHPNGSVEWLAPGLMRGYIDRFAFSRSGERLGPATESWLRVCRRAHALWTAARQAASGPG